MTNEELAILIKNGHEEHLPELWENVRRLMYQLSFKQYSANKELFNSVGLSLEDIQQESYFAVLGAVEAYSENKGYKFTSYLHLQLKHRIRALWGRGDVLNREPLSLDEPLEDETTECDTLHDLIGDPQSGRAIAAFDERQSYALLHEAVSLLPGGLKEVIILRFWKKQTLDQIGEQLGKSRSYIRIMESQALNKLRRGPIGRKLKQAYYDEVKTTHNFIDLDGLAYKHKGLSSFRTTHSSVVEDAFDRKEAALRHPAKVEATERETLEILLAALGEKIPV